MDKMQLLGIYFLFQSLGNHEFDQGVMGVTPFIQNLTCPVLAANLILTKVPELEKERNLKKSIVIMVHGVKIGIVGYLTPDTKTTARPNDVEYIREVDAINDEVKVLNSKGVKIIIALGHSGYVTDMEIAREVEGVDLVVGGHTNTFLWNGTTPDSEEIIGPYPTYVKQKSGRMVPVVQAYAYTKYLGKLLIKFDHRGEVLNIKGNPILLDNTIPQDPEVLTIIERYRTKTLAYDEVIGNTSVILDGRSCNQRECNLGNMITDAIIDHYAKQYTGEHWTDTPIAIMQAGAIRSSIANTKLPHAITKGDILQAMPFDKPLALMTVNASVLLKMLEHAVADYHNIDGPREFLQFSGLKVVYNVKHPPGDRVVSAMARCWNCDIPAYQPIKMGEIYKVIMPDIVALGGDGYDMLPGLPTEILNYNELICTERYVRRHSPVYPEIEGRIIIINEDLHKDTGTNIYPSLHYLMFIKLVMYFV